MKSGRQISQLIFVSVWLAISLTCILYDPNFYSPILGNLDPVIVFSISGILGYLSFSYLRKMDLLFHDRSVEIKTLLYYFLISMAMGCLPVGIDLWQRFPEDINVLLPKALLYYPTIGMLGEIIFHMLPVTLLLLIFHSRLRQKPWILIILVALVEPAFQVLFGLENGELTLRDTLVFLEVFLFSLLQLYVFFRHGFLAMFLCRIGFYLSWHFIWGTLRLNELFL